MPGGYAIWRYDGPVPLFQKLLRLYLRARWRNRATAFVLAVGAAPALNLVPVPAQAKPLSKEAVFNKAAKATVLIVIPGHNKGMIGSGVIIDASGLVITNAHVLELAGPTVQVFLYDAKEKTLANELSEYVKTHTPLIATVKTRNRLLDLALLTLPERKNSYPAVPWADKEILKVGQDVVAIGNPLGLTWTFTTGTVSSLREDMIQTETPINRGNSGGPLLDLHARVVGINTRIRKDHEQTNVFGFAIPARVAQGFVKKWQKRSGTPELPTLRLEKNPVPLLALVLRKDVDGLRKLNQKRGSPLAEKAIEQELVAMEKLGEAALTDDLTVGQVIPQLMSVLVGVKKLNQGSRDTIEVKVSERVDLALTHLRQVAEVAE